MTFKITDTVVLTRDKPKYKLKQGDLGTVVEVYDHKAVEVEFVKPSGTTLAVVTLATDGVRSIKTYDILAVRSLTRGRKTPTRKATGRR